MTGMASRSNLSMIGGSVPGGRRARMVLTLSRTSWAAMSRLRSSTNWITICETPSVVTLLSSSMPWMVLMISSRGLVTLVSISSGDAPRSVAVTVTMGSSTFGNWSMPMSLNENQPSTTRKRLIIVANTGRLMQRSAMPTPLVVSGPEVDGTVGSAGFMAGGNGGVSSGGNLRGGLGSAGRRRLDGYFSTVGQPALAADHDRLPGLHAADDLLQPGANAPGLHGAAVRSVPFYDKHFGDSGEADNRFQRHDGRRRAAL